jgi:adenine/guanine phosphoribosyltransferase-like PRPP-binding protein
MAIEIARLLLGLMIAACHRRIADFIMERERSLVLTFRSKGFPLPAALSTETAHNLYFGVGIFVVLVELLRIYQMGH